MTLFSYSPLFATSYDQYDEMGRVKRSIQTIGAGAGYTFTYNYNRAGSMISQIYPSLRTVSTTYDPALRISSIKGTKSGEPNKTYASNYVYTQHGAVAQMKLGNELWESASYNDRLQPTMMGLGAANGNSSYFKLDYNYGQPTSNNGNLRTQDITHGGGPPLSQIYEYDPLNRLVMATEGSNWSQTYQYDRFGNRWVTPASYIQASGLTPQALSYFDSLNNRLVCSGYDAAGNLITDCTNRTFTYDADNHQTSVTTPSQGTVSYSYDGEGRRVKKTEGGQDTLYVYNALGQLAAEYSLQGPQAPGGTFYLTADHLGSTRVVTDSSSTPAVKGRHDYLPFGEEIPASIGRTGIPGYGGTDGVRQKFTAKERDSESNLDYFIARYYSGPQGRFMSPDPVFFQAEMLTDPQRFNLYSYVRNNPLRYIDPKGEEIELTGETDAERKKQLAAIQSAVGKAGSMLTIVQDKDSGKYLVGVKGGDIAGFAKMNSAAAGFAEIIKNPEVAQFAFAAGHEQLAITDSKGKPITLSENNAVGATGRGRSGQLHVYVLRPAECCASVEGSKFGRFTLGGVLDFLGITTVSADTGTEAGHEFGHALYMMQIGRGAGVDPAKSNQKALDLENAVRKTRDPNAPVRTAH